MVLKTAFFILYLNPNRSNGPLSTDKTMYGDNIVAHSQSQTDYKLYDSVSPYAYNTLNYIPANYCSLMHGTTVLDSSVVRLSLVVLLMRTAGAIVTILYKLCIMPMFKRSSLFFVF